jgi:hypothetical protein
LKKIKRVSFDVFLGLKELVNVNRVNVIRSITLGDNRKKPKLSRKKPKLVKPSQAREYEPSTAIYPNSSLRLWRRVSEWDRYINNAE